MGSLEAFIHRENLLLFKKQLADPRLADAQRRLLLRLLTEEEARDVSDEEGRSAGRPRDLLTRRRPGRDREFFDPGQAKA
jgi:hypothetical protein